MDRYDVQVVGASRHSEWWIPAEDLEAMNDQIVGVIEVIHSSLDTATVESKSGQGK